MTEEKRKNRFDLFEEKVEKWMNEIREMILSEPPQPEIKQPEPPQIPEAKIETEPEAKTEIPVPDLPNIEPMPRVNQKPRFNILR